jgi:hypothetical protein
MDKSTTTFPCFNIIHHAGQVNSATTLDNVRVHRENSLVIQNDDETLEDIKCAPDPDHFVYEEPTGKANRPSYLCTCGAAAVIVDKRTHAKFSSLPGRMFICMTYMTTGKHNTSLEMFNYGKHKPKG